MAPVWRLLAPANHEACLMIDLQGITWKKCQEDVYDHIFRGHALLKSYIKRANDREQTSWYGHIKGDEFHGGNDSKGVQIAKNTTRLDVNKLHFRGFTGNNRERYHASLIIGESPATATDIERAAARTPPGHDVFVTPPCQTGHIYALRDNADGHLSIPEASQPKSPTEIEVLDGTGHVMANLTNRMLEDVSLGLYG
ncbi:hypothetical protein PCASD_09603 [Puccinia coronata f. sp. avenae]|uniref:Uncharacterized protein n=1 Tax=Puccinia coronata f. sp. avenae TaxID=200324 RepID=A0A2N5UPN9_9BASI|nr:hypothetical protein PCASD_09603 [Puccinia coronata f. sp. avenae]